MNYQTSRKIKYIKAKELKKATKSVIDQLLWHNFIVSPCKLSVYLTFGLGQKCRCNIRFHFIPCYIGDRPLRSDPAPRLSAIKLLPSIVLHPRCL